MNQIRVLSGYPPFGLVDRLLSKVSGDEVFADGTRKRALRTKIYNADLAFAYPGAIGGDLIAVLPVPEEWNEDALKFLRVGRPQRILWDPARANLPIALEVLRKGTCDWV